MARTVKTVEVNKKFLSHTEIETITSKYGGVDSLTITSSGPIKILHNRNDELHDVIFLKESERYLLYVEKGDVITLDNLSYQNKLTVYLIQWS